MSDRVADMQADQHAIEMLLRENSNLRQRIDDLQGATRSDFQALVDLWRAHPKWYSMLFWTGRIGWLGGHLAGSTGRVLTTTVRCIAGTTGLMRESGDVMSQITEHETFPGASSYDSPDGHIHIKWQHGPIKEHGVNGVQVDDVLNVLIDRLRDLNQPPYNCRENSLAITKLEEAGMWLRERTRTHQEQGVEGTSAPHRTR